MSSLKEPEIASSAFIAPGACVIGDVCIMEDVSIWHNAVLRGDIDRITIGCGSNIQDNSTLHCIRGRELVIGENVTVGHNAVLHSCSIGSGTLIGMGAVVLDNAIIGRGCIVAAGSVVTTDKVIPDGSLVMGIPASVKRMLSDEEKEKLLENAREYIHLKKLYKD